MVLKRFLISILFFSMTSLMALPAGGTCSSSAVFCEVDSDCPDYPAEICSTGSTNTPPTASNVMITGILTEGQTISVSYTYSDPDTDPESGTTFKWYRDNDGTGNTAELITAEPFGSISPEYTLQAADVGKYMQVLVFPNDGQGAGVTGASSWYGPVQANMVDADRDGVTSDQDCDDSNALIFPGNTETLYNGIDDDCDTSTPDTVDADGDGVMSNKDCDDSNPDINPGVQEIPYDGLNNDCNATTPDDDLDKDHYVQAEDCNDKNATVNPGAQEIPYDGENNDCNLATPDDDLDGDTYKKIDDCNDNEATINPGAEESLGDGIDNDCNVATPDTVPNNNNNQNTPPEITSKQDSVSLILEEETRPRYVRSSTDTVVYDTKNNISWQDDVRVQEETMTYADAYKFCQDLDLDGTHDWRLPNFFEFLGIWENGDTSPHIYLDSTDGNKNNNNGFDYVYDGYYWAIDYSVISNAINFFEDYINSGMKLDLLEMAHVRCMRSGKTPNINIPSARMIAEYSYTLTASDADNDPLTYEAVVKPDWLTFDPKTNELYGTTTNAGQYEVKLSVSDGKETVYQTFTISVVAYSSVPTLTGGGSGCTYNTAPKNIDFIFILLLLLGIFYPFRKRFFRQA